MVVEEMTKNWPYSEFNMMCTVAWWRFRDDYHWVIQETPPRWPGTFPPGSVRSLKEAEIPNSLLNKPVPSVSLHFTYTHFGNDNKVLLNVFRKGYCYSLVESERRPKICDIYGDRWQSINEYEFSFEYDDFSNRDGALQSHLLRITQNDICPHRWHRGSVAELVAND